jgi:hypothetical protein
MKAIALIALAGCAVVRGPAFEERRLAAIPEGAESLVPVAYSADGRTCAYVLRTPEGDRAVSGEWKSKPFDVV